MKIAFVIPEDFQTLIQQVVDEVWPKVQAEYLIYEDYQDAPRIIRGKQHLWDGIIFAGKAAYESAMKCEPQETLWGFFPGWNATFFKALLIASQNWGDITHLSIDSYDPKVIHEIYREIGIDPNELHIKHYVADVTNPLHIKNSLQFHLNNYKTGRFTGCITRLVKVAEELKKRKIPCVFAYPTCDSIREQINFMLKIHMVSNSPENSFTVFSIALVKTSDSFNDYTSDYLYALEREKIASQVFRYALQINGSVVNVSHSEFLIFSERDCIDPTAGSFQELELLNTIGANTLYVTHIGVGCSNSIRQAQAQAEEAQRRIRTLPTSRAFCLLGKDVGFEISPGVGTTNYIEMNDVLSNAAREAGISVQTMYAIYTFISERNSNEFTCNELAKYLKLSIRNTNRLLEKLEAARYVRIVGQIYENSRGRPSRVMRFYPYRQ